MTLFLTLWLVATLILTDIVHCQTQAWDAHELLQDYSYHSKRMASVRDKLASPTYRHAGSNKENFMVQVQSGLNAIESTYTELIVLYKTKSGDGDKFESPQDDGKAQTLVDKVNSLLRWLSWLEYVLIQQETTFKRHHDHWLLEGVPAIERKLEHCEQMLASMDSDELNVTLDRLRDRVKQAKQALTEYGHFFAQKLDDFNEDRVAATVYERMMFNEKSNEFHKKIFDLDKVRKESKELLKQLRLMVNDEQGNPPFTNTTNTIPDKRGRLPKMWSAMRHNPKFTIGSVLLTIGAVGVGCYGINCWGSKTNSITNSTNLTSITMANWSSTEKVIPTIWKWNVGVIVMAIALLIVVYIVFSVKRQTRPNKKQRPKKKQHMTIQSALKKSSTPRKTESKSNTSRNSSRASSSPATSKTKSKRVPSLF